MSLSRLQIKLWLGLGAALLFGFAAVQIDHYRQARQGIEEALLIEARTIRSVLMAARHVYEDSFAANGIPITDRTIDLLPVHALSRIAGDIRQWYPEGPRVKIASRESRDPNNRLDAIESEAWDFFDSHRDQSERLAPFTNPEGRRFFAYTQPIRAEAECLACHGDPGQVADRFGQYLKPATGYVEGDLRAILSISLPIEEVERRAHALFLIAMRDHLLVFLMLFLVSGGLLQHLVIGKLGRIRKATMELARGDYTARVRLAGRDELAELGSAFNRMADRIAERDRQLREAQAYAHLGYWILDATTLSAHWSEEVYRLFGLPSDTAAGFETLRGLLHPDDAQRVATLLHTGIATATEYDIDYRVRRPDGEIRWINCKAHPRLDAQGQVTHLTGFLQDISERKTGERLLQEREQLLGSIFRAAPIGIGMIVERVLQEVNETFCSMLGYRREELLGQNARILYADQAEFERVGRVKYRRMEATGTGSIETRMRRRDGEPIEVFLSSSYFDRENPSAGATFTALDITARNRAQRALEEERAFLQNVIDGIDDPIMVIGSDYGLMRMNRVARANVLDKGLDISCLKCHRISHDSELPCGGDDHPCPLEQVFTTGQPCKLIHRHHIGQGQLRTFEVAASPLRDENDQILGIIEVSRDITEHLALLAEIKAKDLSYAHLAQHDPLTGLPNRLLFADRLSQAIHGAHRRRTRLGVLIIDLDRFKQINDSFNHSYGDQVLKAVAERLRGLFREDDTVSRMGGDEFAVILTQIRDDADAALVARKILKLFVDSFEIQGHDIFLGACIGLSLYPEHGSSVDELVRNADAAMHRAKQEGRNNYQFYARELTTMALERVVLEASLHQSVVNDELVLHYQPQLDLVSGQVCGMEALVRWRHPRMGLVSPARFIPLAEDSGMIIPIGEWVLREATRQMKSWQDAGLIPLDAQMSVNLSTKQFEQEDLIEMIESVLTEIGLDPGALELEITESTMMLSPASTTQRLSRLRRLGVKVAIDDFGTGYSSLSYLKALPLTKLKIDQSFVSDIPNDQNNMAIARAIIGLARSLSLDVLAEGVETLEQESFLTHEGCRIGQGFLFSKPLGREAFEDFLRDRTLSLGALPSPAPYSGCTGSGPSP